MKITTINYQKVFPLGAYVNEKIGLEMSVDDGDNIDEAFKTAKKVVEIWHRNSNPGLEVQVNYAAVPGHPEYVEPSPQEKKDSKQSAEEKMIQAISTCTSIETLSTFKLLVKNNEVFQKAYNERLKQLGE